MHISIAVIVVNNYSSSSEHFTIMLQFLAATGCGFNSHFLIKYALYAIPWKRGIFFFISRTQKDHRLIVKLPTLDLYKCPWINSLLMIFWAPSKSIYDQGNYSNLGSFLIILERKMCRQLRYFLKNEKTIKTIFDTNTKVPN